MEWNNPITHNLSKTLKKSVKVHQETTPSGLKKNYFHPPSTPLHLNIFTIHSNAKAECMI